MSESLTASLGRKLSMSDVRSPQRRRRRRYLIDREFQFKITRDLFGFLLVATILALGNLYVISELSEFYLSEFAHQGWGERVMAWSYGVVAVINSCLVLLLVSLFFSHRIAGPAVKIVNALKQLRDGNLQTPIRLRKRDYLQDVATAVNDAVRHWDGSLDEIDRAIQSLKEQTETIDKSTLDRKLAAIEVMIGRCKVRSN